jgi:transposase
MKVQRMAEIKYSGKIKKPLSAPNQIIYPFNWRIKGGRKERMLSMVQIHHIKHLVFRKGQTLRGTAKDTGHDFRTVQKYVEKEDFNQPIQDNRGRPSKMESFKEIVDTWLKEDLKNPPKQRHTAKRIYERLCTEFKESFNASSRTVRAFVAQRKQELYHRSNTYLPLKHPPGEAQADFGQAVFIEKGKEITCYYLNLSFPYSNASYFQVFKGQNQECLLTGLKDIFEHIGYVPSKIWFDNLSSAVVSIKEKRERTLTDAFQRFSLHYGFEHNFCNPNSGHEKGHVENKVGYNRRNFFVPIPSFESLDEYNQRLFATAENDQIRKHYQKGQLIETLFKEDKAHMLPLPKNNFEIFRLQKAKASKTGKIQLESNTYSTSPDLAGREVLVKITASEVIILDQDYKEVIKHQRLYGKNQESMNWYPYLNVLAKRPTALKYTDFFHRMPSSWQEYINKCNYEQKKAALQALIKMITESDMVTATKALEECLQKELYDVDSILVSYYRMIEPIVINEISLPSYVPDLESYTLDISSYDVLLKGGEKE